MAVPWWSFSTSRSRPLPVNQLPLPPWDASDSGGMVHTVCPPDQIIPKGYTRDWWRGDFSGVMIPENPPLVPGCNTSPVNMIISFLLPHYVQFGTKWVDMILTAHAQRNYSHFHLDHWQFNQAGLSLAQAEALIRYVQSWGFCTSCWLTSSNDNRSGGWSTIGAVAEPFLKMLVGTDASKVILLPGEELNNGCPPGPGGCDDIITAVCAACNPLDIPVWLHFTSNYPGYPTNPPPGVDFDNWMVQWIAQWKGKVRGLAWQSDPNQSAGTMGAELWSARQRWASALGSDGLVAAFELLATEKLYGRCTEEYGCLRGTEMIYCTSDPVGSCPPVAGACDGLRYPDGTPI